MQKLPRVPGTPRMEAEVAGTATERKCKALNTTTEVSAVITCN